MDLDIPSTIDTRQVVTRIWTRIQDIMQLHALVVAGPCGDVGAGASRMIVVARVVTIVPPTLLGNIATSGPSPTAKE